MADITTTGEKQAPNDLLKQTQIQVDELLEISRNNVGQIMERGQILSNLNEISNHLVEGADEFKTQAETFKRKEWLKQFKKKILVFFILFIVLLIVTLILIQTFSKK